MEPIEERYLPLKRLLLINISFFIILFLNSTVFGQNCSQLFVKSNKSRSALFINGKFIETGNNISVNLAKGNYELVLKEDEYSWGAEVFTDSIFINECGVSVTKEYDFKEKIYFTTNPSNVWLYNNDTIVGYTPSYIPGDLRNLTLYKPKYETKTIDLVNINKNISADLKQSIFEDDKEFPDTPLFKVLIGSAIALGATAAYYKIQADDSFEQYENTGNQKYLDDTDKFDIYSGIAFTALQVNFGALIYFFLTD